MKLLAVLRKKVALEQADIAKRFSHCLGFRHHHDNKTVVTRDHGKDAWKWLIKNKQLLLDSFPKEHTKKLRSLEVINEETDVADIIVCFKQVLRSPCIRARMISRKRYEWNTVRKRQNYVLEYKIISNEKTSGESNVDKVCAETNESTNTVPTAPPATELMDIVSNTVVLNTNDTTKSLSETNQTNISTVPTDTVTNTVPTTNVQPTPTVQQPTQPTPTVPQQPTQPIPQVSSTNVEQTPTEQTPQVPTVQPTPTEPAPQVPSINVEPAPTEQTPTVPQQPTQPIPQVSSTNVEPIPTVPSTIDTHDDLDDLDL